MTTFEEAKRCPKCEMPGNEVSKIPAPNRNGVVHTIECVNDRCRWYNTTWIVQVDRNGDIPQEDKRGAKDKIMPKIRKGLLESDFERAREVMREQARRAQQ